MYLKIGREDGKNEYKLTIIHKGQRDLVIVFLKEKLKICVQMIAFVCGYWYRKSALRSMNWRKLGPTRWDVHRMSNSGRTDHLEQHGDRWNMSDRPCCCLWYSLSMLR